MGRPIVLVGLPKPEIAGESDDYLLLRMSMKGEDESASLEAFREFYCRHAEYLYNVCLRYRRVLGGEKGVEDLVQDTFLRAYEHASAFVLSGDADQKQLRLRVRAWLGRISNRLILNVLRSDHMRETPYDPASMPDLVDGAREEEDDSDGVRIDARMVMLHNALAALDEREQDILRVTYLYYQRKRDHQRLPNAIAASLARQWNTTPENIRAIRHRALKKVKQHLEKQGASN